MRKIAVIGAGQIGSRHLQALALVNYPLEIFVIDPSTSSLESARNKYSEATHPPDKILSYSTSTIPLPAEIDLAIIATTANVKREVVENLLENCKVKYFILEKVVFQKPEDFTAIINLFKKNGSKAWVNCPRRLFPIYQEIKASIGEDIVSMTVQGQNWGLACNSIHMVDLFVFLTRQSMVSYFADQLDNRIYDSKRNKFKELRGKYVVKTARGDLLEIKDDMSSTPEFEVNITTGRAKYKIKETQAIASRLIGQNTEQLNCKIPFQSELTNLVAEEILDGGESGLTSIEECSKYHVPFLESLNEHFSKLLSERIDVCPIT
jgi:hypothetical protein